MCRVRLFVAWLCISFSVVGAAWTVWPAKAQPAGSEVGRQFKGMMVHCLRDAVTWIDDVPDETQDFEIGYASFRMTRQGIGEWYAPLHTFTLEDSGDPPMVLYVAAPARQVWLVDSDRDAWDKAAALGVGCFYWSAREDTRLNAP